MPGNKMKKDINYRIAQLYQALLQQTSCGEQELQTSLELTINKVGT